MESYYIVDKKYAKANNNNMKFRQPIPVKEIAQKLDAQLIGDDSLMALGLNEIHKVEKGDITFADVKKYFDKSLQSAASIVILNEVVDCPEGKAILVCAQPFEAYNTLAKKHRPFQAKNQLISDSAVIHPSAIIEPNVVIGQQVRIGKNCCIQANVTISEYTVIQDNVLIQSGSIIGTDAFYFKKKEKNYYPWRSVGRVVIESDVSIGAGCTINKGVSGDTIIGQGSKLDCQVHIGHGVVLGQRCLLAAQVGIGGKTIVGDDVVLYGQVGVAQNIEIGSGAVVLAKSGVSKSLAGGKTYFGIPAGEVTTKYKELAALRQLPDFLKGK